MVLVRELYTRRKQLPGVNYHRSSHQNLSSYEKRKLGWLMSLEVKVANPIS